LVFHGTSTGDGIERIAKRASTLRRARSASHVDWYRAGRNERSPKTFPDDLHVRLRGSA